MPIMIHVDTLNCISVLSASVYCHMIRQIYEIKPNGFINGADGQRFDRKKFKTLLIYQIFVSKSSAS